MAKSDDDAHRDSADQEALKVVVIGTIYKNQPLKPNILKELSEEQVTFTPVQIKLAQTTFRFPQISLIWPVHIFFLSEFTNASNKVECMSLANLSGLL